MDLMDKIVSLCKRRGFIFPGSEIYGGVASVYDYGYYGVLLKNNIKNLWWRDNVLQRDDVIGLDSAILLHPKVWEASGHVTSFNDPLVECKNCHQRFRADHLKEKKCPNCQGKLTAEKNFNLMFRTHIGPTKETSVAIYLRPETAQGIFVDFKTIMIAYSQKIPFGIAQIGKAFRNEITPGNFTFRTREFEQMEIEFFVEPESSKKWHEYWLQERLKWYYKYAISKKNLRLRPHEKKELSHYSAATSDVEFNFPWGWGELEGIANRTDYDLKQHGKYSGKDLSFFDEITKESYIPYVIEPSAGADRLTLAFLIDAYHDDPKRPYLKFHPQIAPIKIAVFPLVSNKPEIVGLAKKIYNSLKPNYTAIFDDRGNIGKRYYAQDEIGTPWCITVDYTSLSDNTVTIRDRDTTNQERRKIDELDRYFAAKLKGEKQ